MLKGLFKRIFRDANQRTIARLQKTVQIINALEPEFQALSDTQLHAKTTEFRTRFNQGESLDALLPEAFAAVREASWRTIGLRHYDVQLIGGMILHQGQIAEMRTGEGKTLVATLPLYLNALKGEGAHLVTPNDYLSKYGVQWMGPVYHALGVEISVIQSGAGDPDSASFKYDPNFSSGDDRFQYLRPITRKAAYETDITYGTNNEFGFDYLRNNLVIDLIKITQRSLHYAIVDEIDSILIDEARTPLIIAGPAEEPSPLYKRFAQLVLSLQRDTDYEIDERSQTVILSEEGVAKVERQINVPEGQSLYDAEHAHKLPYLDNALRAKEFFHIDKKYVVRDGEIIIVDEFTGRLMYGRRYSEGLHQAIEAKQGVKIRRESLTHATITFQNFFRLYNKLAGMTGTAATEAEEMRRIYDLSVIILPTNVEYRAEFGDLTEKRVAPEDTNIAFSGVLTPDMQYKVTVFDGPAQQRFYRRLDLPDLIYKTEKVKFNAVLEEVAALYAAKRPVLIGTTAIETSERLARLFKRRHIPHNILNAKFHAQEAVIIAQAGRPGAVTIATNMAGRGVDILLGGNAEGMAREQLRKKGFDLTTLSSTEWEAAAKMARRGEDPTTQYASEWAAVLRDKIQRSLKDREYVYNHGGLHVIGTERHEARRIDNQLRGRAGRQGDPGSSRFYVSLEDELMRRFGGERLQPWMDRAGLEDAPLEFNVLVKALESIQERVEGYNFDMRKHILEYDNVARKQREVIYAERNKILSRDDLYEDLMTMIVTEIQQVVDAHMVALEDAADLDGLLAELRRFLPLPRTYTTKNLAAQAPDAIIAELTEMADKAYHAMHQDLGAGLYRRLRQDELSLQALVERHDPFYQTIITQIHAQLGPATVEPWYAQPLRRMPDAIEAQVKAIILHVARLYRDRQIMLRQVDQQWINHLTDLEMLREGIGLRAIGQQNPLVAYQKEAFDMYQQRLGSIQSQIVRTLFLRPVQTPASAKKINLRVPRLTARRPQLRASGGSASGSAKPRPHKGGPKLGRNETCWCGSGKKYKDCHLNKDKQVGIVRYAKPDAGQSTSTRRNRSR